MATISVRRGFRSAERPFLVIGDLAGRVLGLLVAWQTRAQQRADLANLDDRALKDVGLSRADIEAETRKPFWQG